MTVPRRSRDVTPPDGDLFADAGIPVSLRHNLAPPPSCTLCGAAIVDPDPLVTCCAPCARQIAEAIVRWLDSCRPTEEKW
jgi:hypothetical protein